MLELFTNPQFLVAGGALISVPIIIHLINRMRFKRLRWAAMEFLLKAQKRNRRRLIIEQLLLLMLRCFLVFLVALLVLRFIGFSLADLGVQQENVHLVLFDDTLSMNDQWKEGDKTDDCHKHSLRLLNELIKKLGQSRFKEKEQLAILPLSRLVTHPDKMPELHKNLGEEQTLEKIKEELGALKPEGPYKAFSEKDLILPSTQLYVPMLEFGADNKPWGGVVKAQEFRSLHKDNRFHLYVFSDFRQNEWNFKSTPGEELKNRLLQLADKSKVWLVDTVHPYREDVPGGSPPAHPNIGILDLRPSTRIAGKGMLVNFVMTLANFGVTDADVDLSVLDANEGEPRFEVNFKPSTPIKLPASKEGIISETPVSFELRFNPTIKDREHYFAQIAVRLENTQGQKLEFDALKDDNVRHAGLEIREKVPILVIDGKGKNGLEDNEDTFFIRHALKTMPSYDVVPGYKVGGGIATALDQGDLAARYASIFMLNVPELTSKQLANLEKFVQDGGGLAFFMGPAVNSAYYNKNLYKGGLGIFPVPLKDTYYPSASQEPLPPDNQGDWLILRHDLFPKLDKYPIMGMAFESQDARNFLAFQNPIRRYFQVDLPKWKPDRSKVFELANLPNEAPIGSFSGFAQELIQKRLDQILEDNLDLKVKYGRRLSFFQKGIEKLDPSSGKKAFHLAQALDEILKEKGQKKDNKQLDDFPDLTEFWALPNPKIRTLSEEITRLRSQALYGDPFMVAQNFGKGKVVAVMTSAGKEWSELAGGTLVEYLFPPIVLEIQNFLTAQGKEANLTLGTPVTITVDTETLAKSNPNQLKMFRYFRKVETNKKIQDIKEGDQFGQKSKEKGKEQFLEFSFSRHLDPESKEIKPGMFVTYLKEIDKDGQAVELKTPEGNKAEGTAWSHVFNVDTAREGNLQRAATRDMEENLIAKVKPGEIRFGGPALMKEVLEQGPIDLSESPWFFLLLLAILIAEQALAVHLSFHLKGDEGDTAGAAAPMRAAA